MKRALCIVASVCGLTACTTKMIVKPVTNPMSPRTHEGVFYALPKTVLLIQVPVLRTQLVLGEFSDLVPIFFPFEEPPVAETRYSLDEPTLSSFGVPDSNQVFLAIVKGGLFEDKKLALSFGEDGTIEKIDAESTHRGLDVLGQTIRSAASIGGKLMLSSGTASLMDKLEPEREAEPTAKSSTCQEVENLLKGGALQASDPFPATVAAACHGLLPEMQIALRDRIQLDTDLPKRFAQARRFLRARETAVRLRALRNMRDSFFNAGNVGSGAGDPLKTSLDALNAEIEGIMAQFFGREVRKTYWRASYQLTLMDGFGSSAQTIELFSYSTTAGICASPVAPSGPVELVEQLPPPARAASCPTWTKVEVQVERIRNQYADVVAAAVATPPVGDRGLFYRVPGKARIVLQARLSTAVTTSVAMTQYSPAIAQFGPIVSLPSTTGGRKTHYIAELHSATGAMKSFTLGSEAAVDKSIVSDLEVGATSLLDARRQRDDAEQKRREAEAEQNDELVKLKREAEVLETQLRIKAAQGKLSQGHDRPE